MTPSKLRRKIAWEAARLIYQQQEIGYYHARLKAARRVQKGWVKPRDLPSHGEIRDELQSMARTHEGPPAADRLMQMRLEAWLHMEHLERFHPRLVGSVLTGHIREDSAIDLHLFSDNVTAVTGELDQRDLAYHVERKQVRKATRSRRYTYIHVQGVYPLEITVYPAELVKRRFRNSVTGKPMERYSLPEWTQFLEGTYPDLDLTDFQSTSEEAISCRQLYQALLLPLESIRGPRHAHPEGDILYHSLQVFHLARNELPYDEEFLLAALLHDVGQAIDREQPVAATLEALEDFITPRTQWLLAQQPAAHALLDGTLGSRARRRLEANESYEELVLLARCDLLGRQPGGEAPELEEALEYLDQLADQFH